MTHNFLHVPGLFVLLVALLPALSLPLLVAVLAATPLFLVLAVLLGIAVLAGSVGAVGFLHGLGLKD